MHVLTILLTQHAPISKDLFPIQGIVKLDSSQLDSIGLFPLCRNRSLRNDPVIEYPEFRCSAVDIYAMPVKAPSAERHANH